LRLRGKDIFLAGALVYSLHKITQSYLVKYEKIIWPANHTLAKI